jgi:probable addiction module antidote protein
MRKRIQSAGRPSGDPKEIAKRLREALEESEIAFRAALMDIIKRRGMTEFARRVGLNRHTLYKYHWGTSQPSLESVIKMITELGVRLTVVPFSGRREVLSRQKKSPGLGRGSSETQEISSGVHRSRSRRSDS